MKKFAHFLEVFIFGARWLLAPLYVGLVGALALLVYRYGKEFVVLVQNINAEDSHLFTIDLLGLLDLVLLGNLILIVLFAGYENFVSKIDTASHEDRPDWMGTVDFSGLKMKLIASIVAISAIALLKAFLKLTELDVELDQPRLLWLVIIHLSFVVSGVLLAVMDWLNSKVKAG